MRARRPLLAAVAAAVLAGGADASAADIADPVRLADERVAAAAGTAPEACLTELTEGAGVARLSMIAPGPGIISAVSAGEGDWDLAVFDTAGRRIAASASPDGSERADGLTLGGPVTVQACRVAGDASGVALNADHVALTPRAADAPPVQLVDVKAKTQAERTRLSQLGLDLTEHGGDHGLGVVLHDAEDRRTLRRAGFQWDVVEDDLVAADLADRRAEARYAARVNRSALPSGRTSYRTLADYEAELKALAAENPGIVKLVTLKEKTIQGRDVLGVEITENPNLADGKPAFFNMGVHHAREWPAGEMAMEWIHELVNGYRAGDARATNVVRNARNIVVPIVNPDGFNVSRSLSAGAVLNDGRPETIPDLVNIVTSPNEYRRKNCNSTDMGSADPTCGASGGLFETGTDPNRNYGALWGGPGADATNPLAQTYRGAGPFSEPETRNVRDVVSRNQVMSLITNHTTAGLVLRAPGIAALGDSVDEGIYKDLGDAMAKENGYFSQKSFELYDTTGTTEDWSYNVTGGLGFTFEVYCGDLNFSTGDCDSAAFHPSYPRVIEEWEGTSAQADHRDPGETAATDPSFGYDGKGNREAYYLAAESALNEKRHGILEGTAPAGATLRLMKQFETETWPQADGQPLRFEDTLETTYAVGSGGRYRWHVNPSTRPIVAKDQGDPNGGTASPPQSFDGGGAAGTADDPNDDGQAVPGGSFPAPGPANYNQHPFTAPAGGNGVVNASMEIRASWNTPASDWDMEVFEADGSFTPVGAAIATSAQGTTTEEATSFKPKPGQNYVVRVSNFASVPAVDDYELTGTYSAPPPFKPAQRETYRMTCEIGGKVIESKDVFVGREQVVANDFPACQAEAARLAGAGAGAGAGTGATPNPAQARSCVVADGLRSVRATPRGRGVRLDFRRRVQAPVLVDVFRQSVRRRVTGEQLVARFPARERRVDWNGRANRRGRTVTDGFYFVRYRIATGAGRDTRRVVLRRSGGRFTVVKRGFHRRASCKLLRGFKLSRPVFGGTTRQALRMSAGVAQRATVRFTVLRGKRVVRRTKAARVGAGKTLRRTLSAKGLRRGVHSVRVDVRRGTRRETATLVSRRL